MLLVYLSNASACVGFNFSQRVFTTVFRGLQATREILPSGEETERCLPADDVFRAIQERLSLSFHVMFARASSVRSNQDLLNELSIVKIRFDNGD